MFIERVAGNRALTCLSAHAWLSCSVRLRSDVVDGNRALSDGGREASRERDTAALFLETWCSLLRDQPMTMRGDPSLRRRAIGLSDRRRTPTSTPLLKTCARSTP